MLNPVRAIGDKFSTYPLLGGKNNSGAQGVKGTLSHMALSGESCTILASLTAKGAMPHKERGRMATYD